MGTNYFSKTVSPLPPILRLDNVKDRFRLARLPGVKSNCRGRLLPAARSGCTAIFNAKHQLSETPQLILSQFPGDPAATAPLIRQSVRSRFVDSRSYVVLRERSPPELEVDRYYRAAASQIENGEWRLTAASIPGCELCADATYDAALERRTSFMPRTRERP